MPGTGGPTEDLLPSQRGNAVGTGAGSPPYAAPSTRRRRDVRRVGAQRPIRLYLLNSFRLTVAGAEVGVPHPARRVLALMALRHHPTLRAHVAGILWPDLPDNRAAANLRSVLWRLRSLGLAVVEPFHGTVGLASNVDVDLYGAVDAARRWLAGKETDSDLLAAPVALEGELLPDWYEEWAVEERERFRQLRLHALEAMADRLIVDCRWGDAVLAALAAVAIDPLRESAHRAVIKVHLAEGNIAEAIRQMNRCERLMIQEVGVPPSGRLQELIAARRE